MQSTVIIRRSNKTVRVPADAALLGIKKKLGSKRVRITSGSNLEQANKSNDASPVKTNYYKGRQSHQVAFLILRKSDLFEKPLL